MADELDSLHPVATLAAVGRAAYDELVTVVVLSLLFSLAAVPVVPVGAAIIALVGTLTGAVGDELDGRKGSERQRGAAFLREVRRQLRRGLPLTGVTVGTVAVTAVYYLLGVGTRSGTFLLGATIGLYAVVLATVVALRASSLIARAPPDRQPSGGRALRDAAYHLLDTPSFSVLVAVFAAIVSGLCLATGVGVVLLLPGLLGLLEVVAFEEVSGAGADRVVAAYRGELRGDGR
ncbi:hypothetical protein ACFO0N_06835 [Halobium salinum]|uniref:Uncharacterized protein n=1 Tax=Halobium salinum TaxID=1364940 RepID=A0ABD5PAD1_9EURY|nr:hypothetical protein [Halobium salinum]